jgi:hypothetical protein
MSDNPNEIGLSLDDINLNFVEKPHTEQSEPDSDDESYDEVSHDEKETWSDNMRTFLDGFNTVLYGDQYHQNHNVEYLEYFSEELKQNDKYNIIGIFGGSCLVYNTETMMIESHNCVVELPPKKNVVVNVEGNIGIPSRDEGNFYTTKIIEKYKQD